MDKWIIIHPTHLLPNPFMTQPAHLAHTQGMRPKQSAGMIKDTWGGNLNT